MTIKHECLGGCFNLHAFLVAFPTTPLIPSIPLHMNCNFFQLTEHNVLGKHYIKILTSLLNDYFADLYYKHLYLLHKNLATSICKHLFFYLATSKSSFYRQHGNCQLKALYLLTLITRHQLSLPSNRGLHRRK